MEVRRSDDGKGNRKIKQHSLIKGRRPKDVAHQVVPYGFHQAKQALEDGAPFVFITEGEPCADAMRGKGLEAVATLGGSNGFNSDRDGGHFDPPRVVVVPDKDKCGVKFALKVAAVYPGCRWLLPFPGTAEWNGAMPKDGGLDVADWIADGATVEDILKGVQEANPFEVVEPVENTFTDMVRATLNAILNQDRDVEMQCRSALKADYKISDGQITHELFKAFTATEVAVARKTSDSVDLSKVEQLGYLKDGWIPSRDVSLVYGPFGTGKTSLLLALAIAAAKGEPFLDRTTPGERLRTLVIATDSGVGPLKKSLDDLGVDPDDSLFKPGHSDQMIWIWGAAAEQGHQSWCADINGVVELRKFVQQNNIAWTLIDSAKSVSSAAGWSYSDNDAVRELLRYMREGICQPLNHSICLLSHDGTGNGTHAGAKSWAEDPSMVISLDRALDHDGRQVGVTAQFKKDRAATVDPHRKLTFSLNRENGGFLLSPEVELIGTCSEAIIDVLYKAHQNGRDRLRRKSIVDEVWAAYRRSQSTVDNTLGQMVARKELTKPKPGTYSLSPSTLQRLTSNRDLYSEVSNRDRKQSETEVLPVPETVPAGLNGNNCSSQGTSPGTSETPVIAADQQEFLPVTQGLPYKMEDDDDDW